MIILLSTLLLVTGLIVAWFAAKTTANEIHAKQIRQMGLEELEHQMRMKKHEDLTERFYEVTSRFADKYPPDPPVYRLSLENDKPLFLEER